MKKTSRKTPPKSTRPLIFPQPTLHSGPWPLIILLALVVFLLAYYRYGVAATVNGRPISRLSYWSLLEKLDKKQTLQQLANEKLIMQEAARKNIRIDQTVIDAEIATIEAKIKEQGQTLESALTAEGITRKDLEQKIILQKTVEKLVGTEFEITQTQIDEYIAKNKASLPASLGKDELQKYVKDILLSQTESEAIEKWFTDLKNNAKIIIR